VKIPPEIVRCFAPACRGPRVSTVNMFGGVAAKVNGQRFAGLPESVMVEPASTQKALDFTASLPAKKPRTKDKGRS